MDAPHQTYTDKSVQLLQKVQSALANTTNTVNLSSEWDFPAESSKRWADLLAKLVEEIHQKGHIFESKETDTVFSVLTSGMVETVELLEVLNHQTSQSLGQLKARVALHAESISLILAHLER